MRLESFKNLFNYVCLLSAYVVNLYLYFCLLFKIKLLRC